MEISTRVKNVIVTGGGSGIGYMIAKKLLEEHCRVVICGRNKEKLENAVHSLNSPDIAYIQHDVTNVGDIGSFFSKAQNKLGNHPLDGLVNCAGIKTTSVCQPGQLETEYGFDAVLDTNLKSVVFLTRRFAEYLRDNNVQGNILNISSAQGMTAKMTTAYQMAKNCVIRFTRGIGKDFAKYGIIINGIAPGCTYSEMTPRGGVTNFNKLHYNQRTLEPSEIADIAVFLMSNKAVSIIGDTICADGGFVTAI